MRRTSPSPTPHRRRGGGGDARRSLHRACATLVARGGARRSAERSATGGRGDGRSRRRRPPHLMTAHRAERRHDGHAGPVLSARWLGSSEHSTGRSIAVRLGGGSPPSPEADALGSDPGEIAGGTPRLPSRALRSVARRAWASESCGSSTTTVRASQSGNPRRLNKIGANPANNGTMARFIPTQRTTARAGLSVSPVRRQQPNPHRPSAESLAGPRPEHHEVGPGPDDVDDRGDRFEDRGETRRNGKDRQHQLNAKPREDRDHVDDNRVQDPGSRARGNSNKALVLLGVRTEPARRRAARRRCSWRARARIRRGAVGPAMRVAGGHGDHGDLAIAERFCRHPNRVKGTAAASSP